MSDPLVMTVEHRLGREEAKRRLQSGFAQARQTLPGLRETWAGDVMEFSLAVMGQAVGGRIDVLDDRARIEVFLPGALGWLARTIGRRISEQTALMLEKR